MRGHLAEGRRWSEEVLAAAPEGDVRLRAKVLDQAGGLAIKQGDAARGRELIEQSIVAYRAVGEMAAVALAMEQLIWPAFDAGDWGRAEDLARQCVDIQKQVGDEHLAAESLMVLAEVRARVGDERSALELMDEALSYNLRHAEDPCPMLRARSGHIALLLGDFGPARARLEEAVRYSREAGQLFHLSGELGWLGEVAYLDGAMAEAEGLFTQQLSASKEQGAWVWTRHALLWLAKVAVRRGDVEGARPLVEELQSMRTGGIVSDPEELEAVVELLAAEGRCHDAAHLLGTAEALREALGEPVPRAYRPALERVVSQVVSGMGPEPFAAARAEGRRALDSPEQPAVSRRGR
jgi:tetratricopeptide (TPR) repeat protein